LWSTLLAEFEFDNAASLETLHQACAAADRAEACRVQIAADGVLIRTKTGVRDHQARHRGQGPVRAHPGPARLRFGADQGHHRPAAGELTVPTKRRKVVPRRIGDRLTEEQRQQLMHGILLRRGPFPFPSEDAARTAWQRNRDELMAWPRYPGCRPWGFWKYEAGVTPGDWWMIGCLSEAHAVHRRYADAAERAQIEAEWLRAVRALPNSPGQDHVQRARDCGIPREFAEQHPARGDRTGRGRAADVPRAPGRQGLITSSSAALGGVRTGDSPLAGVSVTEAVWPRA
jgi:hypothetical protein